MSVRYGVSARRLSKGLLKKRLNSAFFVGARRLTVPRKIISITA